jgi:hypothetical protein
MKKFLIGGLRGTVLAVALGIAAGASQAATTVTVEGTLYEIETITGTFLDNRDRLESQPWFATSSTTAQGFANGLADELGFGSTTPLFAYVFGCGARNGLGECLGFAGQAIEVTVFGDGSRAIGGASFGGTEVTDFAAVVLPPPPPAVPVPAAFPLLLAGLGAMAALRRRR